MAHGNVDDSGRCRVKPDHVDVGRRASQQQPSLVGVVGQVRDWPGNREDSKTVVELILRRLGRHREQLGLVRYRPARIGRPDLAEGLSRRAA